MRKKFIVLAIAFLLVLWFLFSLISGCNSYSDTSTKLSECTCIGTTIQSKQSSEYAMMEQTTDYCVGFMIQKTTYQTR